MLAALIGALWIGAAGRRPPAPEIVEDRRYQTILLEALVIPLSDAAPFDFLALGVGATVALRGTLPEPARQIQQLRAAVYDSIRQELNGNAADLSFSAVRRLAFAAVERHVHFGDVETVYITECFAL